MSNNYMYFVLCKHTNVKQVYIWAIVKPVYIWAISSVSQQYFTMNAKVMQKFLPSNH